LNEIRRDSSAAPAARVARRLQLVALVCVIALAVLTMGWLSATGVSTIKVVIATIIVVPLLFAWPRLRAGERRTYAWTTLAIIPFFVLALTEAIANPAARAWAGTCLIVALLSFVALIGHLRATRGG
jgi:uncharacterized membrane protein